MGVAAFETQVHTEPVISSFGINVYEHGQYVVASHPVVADLNFIESPRKMLDAEFALVVWLHRGYLGLPLPLLNWWH